MIKNKDKSIILLNDTRLTSKSKINLESHELVRCDHASNTAVAGGAAMAVPKTMAFKPVNSNFNETSIIEVDLLNLLNKNNGRKIDKTRTKIITRNLHLGKKIEKEFFEEILQGGNSDLFIVMGDLNGRMNICQGEGWNDSGQKIWDYAEEFGFTVENDGSPTFFPAGGGSLASLDVCLVKSKFNLEMSWQVLDSVGSDHLNFGSKPTNAQVEKD